MSHTDLKQWLFRKADRSNPIDNPKIYYATTAILLIFLGLTFWKKPKIEGTSVNQEVAESLDLLIPKGMTAYPIPLENAEALTGMVQDFVVVDLYSASSNPPTRKLASSVRLIRAPAIKSALYLKAKTYLEPLLSLGLRRPQRSNHPDRINHQISNEESFREAQNEITFSLFSAC